MVCVVEVAFVCVLCFFHFRVFWVFSRNEFCPIGLFLYFVLGLFGKRVLPVLGFRLYFWRARGRNENEKRKTKFFDELHFDFESVNVE